MDDEEKVFRIYEVMTRRIMNSDRLLAERSNLFLLTNSILLAGFFFFIDESSVLRSELLRIVIPCAGILLSAISGFVSWGVTREMHLWLMMCQQIEQKQPAFEDLKTREFIPYSAWNYWAHGDTRFIARYRERGVPLDLPPENCTT